jgi:hypothetical protein
MTNRYTGSGRQIEGGMLATHKQDFNAHVTGGDWRHKADQVDMNPVLTAPYNGTDVQTVLSELVTTVSGQRIGEGQASVNFLGVTVLYPINMNPAQYPQYRVECTSTGTLATNKTINIYFSPAMTLGNQFILMVKTSAVTFGSYHIEIAFPDFAANAIFSGIDNQIYTQGYFKYNIIISKPFSGADQLFITRTDYL